MRKSEKKSINREDILWVVGKSPHGKSKSGKSKLKY